METGPLEKNRVQEILTLHNGIISDLKRSLDSAIRIGELLTEQKENLKHGQFGPWIQSNLPFTDRTARNYMRVYREKDRLKSETVSDLKSAYRLLSAPNYEEIDLQVSDEGDSESSVLMDVIINSVQLVSAGSKVRRLLRDYTFKRSKIKELLVFCLADCVQQTWEEKNCSWERAFNIVATETGFPVNYLIDFHLKIYGFVTDDIIYHEHTEEEKDQFIRNCMSLSLDGESRT